MSHHVSTVVGAEESWQAKCSCRWRSRIVSRPDAVEAMDQHQAQVQRAQAALRRGSPSLRTLRQHYLQEANSTAYTTEERDLWRRLADELEPFIRPPSDKDQLTLWE